MNYKIVNITTSAKGAKRSILVIYTGGTFGMVFNDKGSLAPFNFGNIIDKIPVLKTLEVKLTVISFPEPTDSSNITINHWQDIGFIIQKNYSQYDGFVVLHGTDTMAYTASALSFMLEGLNKPVIFTGAQIPIGSTRSDARENLMTAIEIAADYEDGRPKVPEVCIFFSNMLLRGNRAQKIKSSHFAAFESQNYPALAVSGVFIEYNYSYILPYKMDNDLHLHKRFDTNVTILKLHPGISQAVLVGVLGINGLKGLVLESYGSGNIPNESWLLSALKEAIEKGLIILNVSQCIGGRVIQGRYETSRHLDEIGVISGRDLTTEAAISKMMFLLGKEADQQKVKELMTTPICGEMT